MFSKPFNLRFVTGLRHLIKIQAHNDFSIAADAMFEAALEAGAQDVDSGGDGHEITTAIEDFASVSDALEAAFGAPESAGLTWKPQNTVEVDEDKALALMNLIDALEDSDDVRAVASNLEISDEVMEKLGN